MATAEKLTPYDPKELFRKVPLSPTALANSTGETISEDEAVLRILQRWGFDPEKSLDDSGEYRVIDPSTGQPVSDAIAFAMSRDIKDPGKASVLEAVARVIAKALKPGLRNDGVISQLDMPAILAELSGKNLWFKQRKGFTPWNPLSFDTQFIQTFTPEQASTYSRIAQDFAMGLAIDPNTGRRAESDASVWQRTRGQRQNVEVVNGQTAADTGTFNQQTQEQQARNETLSEDELRKIFAQSASSDIRQLEELLGALQGSAPEAEPTIRFETHMLGQNPDLPSTPITSDQGARLTWRAASNYLINGKASPSQIRTLQRRMVLAGLFDTLQDGYVPGDALDVNTNDAYQRLLGEAYRRNMTVDDTLTMLAAQRSQKMPSLTTAKNRVLFNMSAQELVGRDLTDVEYEGLVSYLNGLRSTTGIAALGGGSGVNPSGYSDVDVTSYLAEELQQEVEGVGSVVGMNNLFSVLKGSV